jgi:anti-sigma regulatory factor (Ser/Thr protein kinase)
MHDGELPLMACGQNLARTFTITGNDFVKAGWVSIAIKDILRDLGIDPAVVRRVGIMAYEAEMNVVIYAQKGTARLEVGLEAIQIILEDEGPGIEDINLAMQEGYSTAPREIQRMGFGSGMGLPNIKKNADQFELTSTPGRGTHYDMVVFLNSRAKR